MTRIVLPKVMPATQLPAASHAGCLGVWLLAVRLHVLGGGTRCDDRADGGFHGHAYVSGRASGVAVHERTAGAAWPCVCFGARRVKVQCRSQCDPRTGGSVSLSTAGPSG